MTWTPNQDNSLDCDPESTISKPNMKSTEFMLNIFYTGIPFLYIFVISRLLVFTEHYCVVLFMLFNFCISCVNIHFYGYPVGSAAFVDVGGWTHWPPACMSISVPIGTMNYLPHVWDQNFTLLHLHVTFICKRPHHASNVAVIIGTLH